MISDSVKIDKAWKFVQGIGISSPGKEFYEEDSADSGFTLHGNDIYVNDIPETPPGISSAIVEVVADFVLINDISVPGNLSWYASTDGSTLEQMRATRQGDWIPPRFGQGYTIILKDNTGQQIFTTDSINWVFDYKTGILICEGDPDISYSLPLKITAYRYIGERLTGIGGTAAWIDIEDAGDYFTSDNVEDALQELGLGLDTTNTNLSDHLADTVDSHDASSISVLDTADYYAGTEVEAVLAEIGLALDNISVVAADVTVVDVGGYFDGDNVEDILAELVVDVNTNTSGLGTLTTTVNDHLGDADDAHDASAISIEDIDEKFDSDNVEGTLSELWGSVDLNVATLWAHIYTSDESHLASVITITDTLGKFTSDNVEDALIELINAVDTNISNIANNASDILQNANNFNDHLADTVDSHDASSISVLDTGDYYAGTEVEAVLAEIAVEVDANTSGLGTLTTNFNDHLSDTVDSHDASSISVLDTGDYYAGTEVEAVLAEIGLTLDNLSVAASAITVADAGEYFVSDNVEDVLQELADRVDGNIANILNNATAISVLDGMVDTNIADISNIYAILGSLSATAVDITIVDAGDYFTSDNVEGALQETGSSLADVIDNLSNHLADTVDSHDASSISVLDTADYYTGTEVESVLAEIGLTLDNLSAAAVDITIVDAGDYFTSDNVEGALQETGSSLTDVIDNLSNHLADTVDSHDASSISVLDTAENFIGVEVETVLAEIMTIVDSNTAEIISNAIAIDNLSSSASEISVLDVSENFTGDNVEDVLVELIDRINENTADVSINNVLLSDISGDLSDHLSDTVDSHDASSISVLDTGDYYAGTEVEAVLAEIAVEVDANTSGIGTLTTNFNDHLADTVDSHDASSISVLDTADNFAGDNVESILAELKFDIEGNESDILDNAASMSDHLADTVDSHDASAISVLDTGDYLNATDVEVVLEELIISVNDNDAKVLEHEVRITDLETDNINTNEYTPTGTADSTGNEGDITYDDDFIYVKTSTGWQRAALSTF